ncbi:putative ORfan [Saudi moumouvirus]|nr:putative ORfan [Saudi moumouvirus]
MNDIGSWIFMTALIFLIIIILYFTTPVNNPEVWIYVGIIIVLVIIIMYLITIPVTIRFTCKDLVSRIDYDTSYHRLQNNVQ